MKDMTLCQTLYTVHGVLYCKRVAIMTITRRGTRALLTGLLTRCYVTLSLVFTFRHDRLGLRALDLSECIIGCDIVRVIALESLRLGSLSGLEVLRLARCTLGRTSG